MKRALPLALCAATAFALSACGFHPLYGTQGGVGAAQLFASIYVEPVPDRAGYELRNRLIDLLDSNGNSAGARYRLKVDLNEDRRGVALQNDASITRYNYLLAADYTLTDASGTVVTHGHETTLTSYNIVASPYATLVAAQDAERRGADDLSERIRLDLGVFFARREAK
jgi:LPS-assembly lipoprotein